MKNQNTIHAFKYWITKPEHWIISDDGAKILTSMFACAAIILTMTHIILF